MGPPWGATKGLTAPEQKGIKLILGFSKLFPVPFPSEGLSGAPVFKSIFTESIWKELVGKRNSPNTEVPGEA